MHVTDSAILPDLRGDHAGLAYWTATPQRDSVAGSCGWLRTQSELCDWVVMLAMNEAHVLPAPTAAISDAPPVVAEGEVSRIRLASMLRAQGGVTQALSTIATVCRSRALSWLGPARPTNSK